MTKRTFKKLLLKARLLDIEEQECKEADEKYAAEYYQDFQEEYSVLKSQQVERVPVEKEARFKVPASVLKKLHRKLAMVTHPDTSSASKNRNEDPDTSRLIDQSFIDVQSAYELGDAAKLLTIANDMDIEVVLTEKEMFGLAEQLLEKRQRLDKIKLTVRWAWCKSDKSEKVRSEIRRAIGIPDKVWDTYLLSKLYPGD